MTFAHRKLFLAIGAALVLAACGPSETASGPVDITASTACSLDGMTLAEYPGPKGQIQYEGQAEPMFFCDTVEMFSIYLKPEQVKKIKAIYVQDMSKTRWEEPKGAWMDAHAAYYVVGSKMHGSMGPTIGAFSVAQDATAFAEQNGGKVYKFDEITPDMAALDGGALHDHQM